MVVDSVNELLFNHVRASKREHAKRDNAIPTHSIEDLITKEVKRFMKRIRISDHVDEQSIVEYMPFLTHAIQDSIATYENSKRIQKMSINSNQEE